MCRSVEDGGGRCSDLHHPPLTSTNFDHLPMPTTGAETRELTDELKKRRVRFLLLQFTDLLGVNKAVGVPASHLGKALAGEVRSAGPPSEGSAGGGEAVAR